MLSDIFGFDSSIRYVGLVDEDSSILKSKLRGDVRNLVPPEEEKNFIAYVSPIAVTMAKKLDPFFGTLDYLSIQYKAVLLFITVVQNITVIVALDAKAKPRLLTNLAMKIKGFAQAT
jgi:hypothetical protein